MKQLKLLALFIIPLGIIIAAVPADRVSQSRLTPHELLQEAGAGMQFITPDAVADLLVQKDPSLRLIDVRTPEEFDAFSLPGAVNIPLSNLLAADYTDILNQDAYVNVFYSNGSVYANQAWMITRQLGYENNFVLEGGLNYWFGNILSPEAPSVTSPNEEFAKYDFRKSAAAALGGGGVVTTEQTAPAVKAVKPPVTAKAKKKPSGGC
ncbi:MAG: rhodanese-like domain-containing protein [Bacteroidales bacterium]|jgi:rhodanese-related sulfurtransferase|nr:rhodanese-like domain-containing protein [Bacteroidales bacterium]